MSRLIRDLQNENLEDFVDNLQTQIFNTNKKKLLNYGIEIELETGACQSKQNLKQKFTKITNYDTFLNEKPTNIFKQRLKQLLKPRN